MTSPTISLLDRAGLAREDARRHLARGLEGADDGELYLEYAQSEMLVFDNGRLKQATYNTDQGFGLRAVKDEAVGYAHSSDLSEAALARAADAVRAVKGGYGGCYAEPPGRTNVRLYGDDNPLGAPDFETKVRLLETIASSDQVTGMLGNSCCRISTARVCSGARMFGSLVAASFSTMPCISGLSHPIEPQSLPPLP